MQPKPRAFLIHWNKEELSAKRKVLRQSGFIVMAEPGSRFRAMKSITARHPDVVVIYLSRLPSHGVRFARELRRSEQLKMIPVVFVDGSGPSVGKIKEHLPDARITTEQRLPSVLQDISSFYRIHSLIRKELLLWQ